MFGATFFQEEREIIGFLLKFQSNKVLLPQWPSTGTQTLESVLALFALCMPCIPRVRMSWGLGSLISSS